MLVHVSLVSIMGQLAILSAKYQGCLLEMTNVLFVAPVKVWVACRCWQHGLFEPKLFCCLHHGACDKVSF
jgi:hypothetical protein